MYQDPCVWMRENKTLKCYEYLAIYVDDLCIAAQDPGQIIQSLKEDFKLKVKGDGPLSHHLGADYTILATPWRQWGEIKGKSHQKGG